MVVVKGSWVKNAVPYSLPIDKNLIIMAEMDKSQTLFAKAVLSCRPNSHEFQERTITIEEPVKVGRSVAHTKPSPSNAIFDCKVLSRHHALLWFENGSFYLQDTKSSNGTFVNNNRLSADKHEVYSGDIVQFGVDVVENNRKVTHGCIVATLRLYFPDGTEATASPSITEGDAHGVVPLDDLYKLSQILQEANQREQCLESKLNALQNVVDETKKSAEESWQAYVGEERLLSRLSMLETQLQQARSNWSEDKLKEEICKLRENNEQYQEAAKDALEKVHAEKQQAIMLAMEQERAKISAEQDALLAREQLEQAQVEIQEIAQKLTELQAKASEEKQDHERQVRMLEQQIEEEEEKIVELKTKIYDLQNRHIDTQTDRLIMENDIKLKEQLLARNDIISDTNHSSNESESCQTHISLTVSPVENKCDENSEKTEEHESEFSKNEHQGEEGEKNREDGKRVSFQLPEDDQKNGNDCQNNGSSEQKGPEDEIDSRTLKYQYQSAQREQNELRRKIETLERNSETNKTKIAELSKALSEAQNLNGELTSNCTDLRCQLSDIEQKWTSSREENTKLIEQVNELIGELEKKKTEINETQEAASNQPAGDTIIANGKREKETNQNTRDISILTSEELLKIEEELVLLKEKYAQSCEEKMMLQKDLVKMRMQYDTACDNMYNKYFWYVGPIIILVLYLLIRQWIS